MNKPKLLLTNDDGYDAAGILELCNALKDDFEISIVAPMVNQSCKGLSISLPRKLEAMQCENPDHIPFWKVDSTPADCVKFALHYLYKDKPDLIISGINNGWNSGRNVLYSGTIGAAIQATFYGLFAIAYSVYEWHSLPDFSEEKKVINSLTHHFLKHKPRTGTLMNINFPSKKKPQLGVRIAKQGKSFWNPTVKARENNVDFFIDESIEFIEEDAESDIYLLTQGYVTCTPLHVNDLTDKHEYEKQKIALIGTSIDETNALLKKKMQSIRS